MADHPQGIIELDNPIRDYAWGSSTAIAALLGHEPTGRPEAELWIGAHPDSPSVSAAHPDRPGLDELIAADPAGLLGSASRDFEGRLPFLLKVLAAERALSIQVHPNRAQAEAGFAAEQGLAADDPRRNYRDANHKPEMAYAVTEFEAFCGFRPARRTVALFDSLGVAELAGHRDRLLADNGLRTVFSELLTLPEAARARLIAAVLDGCRRLARAGGEWSATAAASLLAAEDFPGDIGPVLALLLNYVRLMPGEAIFLGAGNVHAYLRGVCVELLASSDNVLRCGLTGKHIDVAELIRVADFEPLAEPRWPPARVGPAGTDFEVPVPDFSLSVRDLASAPAVLPGDRPYLALAGEYPVRLTGRRDGGGADPVLLPPWHAAFIPASMASCELSGVGRAFVATVGTVTV